MAVDIKILNEIVQQNVTDKEVKFELNRKFQGEYKKLSLEEAKEFFRQKTGFVRERVEEIFNSAFGVSEAPGKGTSSGIGRSQAPSKGTSKLSTAEVLKYKDRVKKEFLLQAGPQQGRLLREIDDGIINSDEELENAIKREKKDLEEQKRKIQELKESLKVEAEGAFKDLKNELANIEGYDDLINGIDGIKDFVDLVELRSKGLTEQEIRDEFARRVRARIQELVNTARSEADAIKSIQKTCDELEKMNTQDSRAAKEEIVKVLDSMGVFAAKKTASEKMLTLKTWKESEVEYANKIKYICDVLKGLGFPEAVQARSKILKELEKSGVAAAATIAGEEIEKIKRLKGEEVKKIENSMTRSYRVTSKQKCIASDAALDVIASKAPNSLKDILDFIINDKGRSIKRLKPEDFTKQSKTKSNADKVLKEFPGVKWIFWVPDEYQQLISNPQKLGFDNLEKIYTRKHNENFIKQKEVFDSVKKCEILINGILIKIKF